MEFTQCPSLFDLLSERNGNYCLGTSVVLCNLMSLVGLESRCWLAWSGQRVLCAAEYESKNVPDASFNKCVIYFHSFNV